MPSERFFLGAGLFYGICWTTIVTVNLVYVVKTAHLDPRRLNGNGKDGLMARRNSERFTGSRGVGDGDNRVAARPRAHRVEQQE